MESPSASPDHMIMKGATLNFESDEESSRDSGYGSPEMTVGAFSLGTPVSKPLLTPNRNFNIGQVKRSLVFKRSRDEVDDDNARCKKRHRSLFDENEDVVIMLPEAEVTSDVVKKAVDKMESDGSLVGDGSKTHTLPTVRGRHKDLKSLSPSTVDQLLEGKYDDVISGYVIIDSRYPYEFAGGHIKGAINLHTESQISDFINRRQNADPSLREILVFHCEFSSERGPKLLRHLRGLDRKLNIDRYPFLFYPEVYLLDRGYKAFFEQHKHQCQPQTYLPMLHEDFSSELRHFRSTKAQAGRQKKRAVRRRHPVETSPSSFAL